MKADDTKTVFLLGATGATGRLLLGRLLLRGHRVRAFVRSLHALPTELRDHPRLELTEGTVLDLDEDALRRRIRGCAAVACCLGHRLNFKGMFGPPRKLVTDSIRRVCAQVAQSRPRNRVRLVLMGSSGVRNRDLAEHTSPAQRSVIFLLRWLVPPHRDNELAAEFLRVEIGQSHPFIEWSVARPDGLVDEDEVSRYEVHRSPTRSAIFDSGSVSRANVAHFMCRLASDNDVWDEWQGRMPVIYARTEHPVET